jgi:hypothetical protein
MLGHLSPDICIHLHNALLQSYENATETKLKLHGLSPRANYTNQATSHYIIIHGEEPGTTLISLILHY